MDYALFDLLAVALPAAVLLRGAGGRHRALVPAGALGALALAWTAPWDAHLVRTGVWGYDAGSVVGHVAGVPLEEYAFVVLQVLLVAAWALRVHALPDVAAGGGAPARERDGRARRRGALGWLAVSALSLALLVAGGHARYLGLLLVWVAPPLALQRAVAGDVLVRRRTARLRTVVPVALWLCVADRLALAQGVWTIAPGSSTGWSVLGLPVEEALFFTLTCMLVADGLQLACDPAVLRRCARLPRRLLRGRRSAGARPSVTALG